MATNRQSANRNAKTRRSNNSKTATTDRITVIPPSGVLRKGASPGVDVVSDEIVKADIARQADSQRHEHKSTRYRESFSIAAMGIILLFGLYWASFLEKAEMAELGKYIVTTMIGTVIAYFFATRSKH
jgi:hypothetical protein